MAENYLDFTRFDNQESTLNNLMWTHGIVDCVWTRGIQRVSFENSDPLFIYLPNSPKPVGEYIRLLVSTSIRYNLRDFWKIPQDEVPNFINSLNPYEISIKGGRRFYFTLCQSCSSVTQNERGSFEHTVRTVEESDFSKFDWETHPKKR